MLHLYKQNGETAWLEKAAQLAQNAVSLIRQWSLRRTSLYRGEVGVALLIADLHRPEAAFMPFFEHEGWPVPAHRAWQSD